MMVAEEIEDQVLKLFRQFCLEREVDEEVGVSSDVMKDLGLTSEDGVDFAVMMSDSFDLPPAFNPFVDDEKQCSRTVRDMIDAIRRELS